MDHWICFLSFLRVALCLTNVHYNLHSKEAIFDHAVETCQHSGFLTDMVEEEEAAKIISLIENTYNHAGTLHFWVGLKKSRSDCVLDDQPLKGFKWIISNSNDTKVGKWMAEPEETCTSVLCGVLTAEYNGKKVTDWGWDGRVCKEKLPFICRINKQEAEIKPECDTPHIFAARNISFVKGNPHLLEVHCESDDKFKISCSPDTKEWTVGSGTGEITEICLACHPGYTKSDMGSCIDIDECVMQPCKFGCTNTQGSYTCQCDAAMGYVPSEDSKSCEKLLLPTDAPVATTAVQFLPFTTVSPQAANGQGSLPPLPTLPPSPSVTTTGSSGTLGTSEGQPSTWVKVLAIVLSLVVLVLMVGVALKCCLRKRSKKLSKDKGGKSKEAVVLKAADSGEELNQKDIV